MVYHKTKMILAVVIPEDGSSNAASSQESNTKLKKLPGRITNI